MALCGDDDFDIEHTRHLKQARANAKRVLMKAGNYVEGVLIVIIQSVRSQSAVWKDDIGTKFR